MTARLFHLLALLPMALFLSTIGGSSAHAQDHQEVRIIFARAPATLLEIDGDPVYRHIESTRLDRIVNTNALIVRDPTGVHYVKILDGWMEAYELTGDWSVAGVSPLAFNMDVTDARRLTADPLLDIDAFGSPTSLAPELRARPPAVYVATRPAALVVTDGPPRYETIPGTSLQLLVNTMAEVFREPTDHELYVFVLDRWFRSWRTHGRWEFVPSEQLPSDIATQIALTGSAGGSRR